MNIFEENSSHDLVGLYNAEIPAVAGTVEKTLERMVSTIEKMQSRGEDYCSMCRELYYKLHDIVLDEYEMSRQKLENIERALTDIEVF